MASNQGDPPSYEAATSTPSSHGQGAPKVRNGIPAQSRRSMEDEGRALPPGWVRQYDAREHHQFFIDTRSDPPRSIWQHPYDDDTYMSSLAPEERARIRGLHRVPSEADVEAESSDDDEHSHGHNAPLPPRSSEPPIGGVHKLGRRMKDKITGSTHEEREVGRRKRAEQEQQTYARHQMYRQAMSRALETGEPQLIGKDRNGRDVYIESPYGPGRPYGGNGYGYNPYNQGPYGNPNVRYMRPQQPYRRPYGYGYGGGLGLPLGMGILGGGLLAGSIF
ncbi:hypothetical protein PVAG01_00431 [Phlyctema vagabunda]|uniref:WW domain-containing protein n=1 Tax=Phlyctema vagabunda TaxID=108571 RepID=A0ABR4PUT9_9HELO